MLAVGNVIINTSSIEHECVLADTVHIGPGAVLAEMLVLAKEHLWSQCSNNARKEAGEDVVIGAEHQ
jgi:UDP-3-O-[3-hydroxymyristoyl] glucosamine N-acyltransferase